MPIHVSPLTRRELLRRSAVAGAALVLCPAALDAAADAKADPHRFALLSDTHVDASAGKVARGANLTDCFTRVCKEVAALEPRPAAAIVCGDCAFDEGLKEDYTQFARVAKRITDAKLPLSILLGNHDHRANFWSVLKAHRPAKELVAGRQVLVVEAPRANWFLLDSLERTRQVAGLLGGKQLAWLAKALDARADKPAIVMVHHDPQFPDDPEAPKRKKVTGLKDTQGLFELLAPRRHVKACIYGHSHAWRRSVRDGLHLVCLPSTAYVFDRTQPTGWVLARLAAGGITLELRALDAKHTAHGEKIELTWRR